MRNIYRMNEQLEKKLKELPEAPGIYQMLDKNGNIIYIGKSKCLKKRVQSYFVASPVWDKAKEISRFIVDLEIIVTDTHLEAMLLECEMIKRLKPHFNSMMKNDQKYSYLTVEENCRRNPLKITATREEISFGPFRSKSQMQDIIEMMRNIYPITKNRSKYEFEYHIFPCEMEKEVFEVNRGNLEKIFSKKTEMERFLKAIEREMKRAAEEQSFERALKYRDLHLQLTSIQKSFNRFEKWQKTDLVYVVPLKEGYKLFYVADGIILWKERVEENSEEIHYDFIEKTKRMNREILLKRTEKELLDYRDIIYAELSQASEYIYEIK